jgi:rod shape-determining protein MreC
MNDEQIQPGEKVLTSGGDEIFPKGLLVGTVSKAVRGPESFLSIQVKPAADLGRLEEVLVITQKEEREPDVAGTNSRAVDILAQRLPSVPDKPPAAVDGKDKNDQPSAIPAAEAPSAPQEAATEATTSKKPPTAGSPSPVKSPSAMGTSPVEKKISPPVSPPIILPKSQTAPAPPSDQPQ